MTQSKVFLVSIDTGNSCVHTNEHYKSIDSIGCLYGDSVPYDLKQMGGPFLQMMDKWFSHSDADYIGYLPTSCVLVKGALERQIDFMKSNNLVASYGDIVEIDDRGNEMSWEHFRDFSHEMIGLDVVPTETMLIDRKAFQNVGGFDHILVGSCKPNVYLVTMASIAGRILKYDDVLVKRYIEDRPLGLKTEGLLAWRDPNAEDTWNRFRFDKFILQAKHHYKDMKWN